MRDAVRQVASILLAALLAAPAIAEPVKPPELMVFGAASLTNAVQELADAYTKSGRATVRTAFAGSSALARQIESGAGADVFISADAEWMDYLEQRKLIRQDTRRNLLGNELVLVAPAASGLQLRIGPGFNLASALGADGRLATGDPELVPVGRYARAALQYLGVWESVKDRLVRTENVRAALAFVVRGEAPLGIVYVTDAAVEPGVRVVDTFAADTHPPIVYPVALTQGARPGAGDFVEFLRGPDGAAVFQRFGFVIFR